MNRNTELHFSHTPQIDIKRSKFAMPSSHKTTFNVGDCIPLYVDSDILPGDTVQMDMAELVRMATPIYPIMDNLYMDIYWFFCPHRLVWDHWQEFWGENDDPWTQETEYEIPQITAPSGGWTEGTIADYMGIPTKIGNISVNALPFRSFAKTWNDWFRDENLKKCCHVYKDETTRTGTNGTSYVTDVELGGKPPKVAKMHDYFTSALPSMQKGPAVTIPIGSDRAPVTGSINATTTLSGLGSKPVDTGSAHKTTFSGSGMEFLSSKSYTNKNLNLYADPDQWNSPTTKFTLYGRDGDINQNTTLLQPSNLWANVNNITATTTGTLQNTYADLSSAVAATISQLRTAFAIQKYYENAGLHGTRYIEYIRSVFGVTSSDARMQRSEYLGGQRVPINIDQILQTSSTDSTSPQGNTAGFSCTINQDSMFTKSFEEHGTLLCIACIRTEHTYQQGLKRMWTRKKWVHFYNPFFAHLSEQPVEVRELYCTGTSADTEAFGYQEAWADYRYKNNYVSGYMRSNATGSLDVWHFADNYNTQPILGTTWIDEPYENVDRTIAVTSQLTHQFIGDFYFNAHYTRPMPVYSVPGLIDHV